MDDADIEDLFSGLGLVTIRRMFGGKGIYHNGLIVAIDLGGEVMLKADSTSAPEFRAANARQWSYENRKKSGLVFMPYWSIPEAAFDDPDEMAKWTRLAYDAARRSAG